MRYERLRLSDRVVLALQSIERPAHYSEVWAVHNSMFPEKQSSEKSIHATLSREEKGVVWVGVKGTYALKEWGYQRPAEGLFDLVAKIVKERYQSTSKPVPFSMILAEVSKRRKIVRRSSVVMAASLNPELEPVGDSCYIPRADATLEESAFDEDELDRILQEFDGELDDAESG